jgi:hypothetical protein
MKLVFTVLLILVASLSGAEETIDLWQGEAPYSKPNTLEEYVKKSWRCSVSPMSPSRR